MSANLKDSAAFAAGPLAMVWKQAFHSVPKIPTSINLKGRTAIVTGASGGLGLECSRQFLQIGLSKLILAVRSTSKGESAREKLHSQFPEAEIEIWDLDMESSTSVKNFVTRCGGLDRLDVVILNAGCGKQTYSKSDNGTGREITLQVNYINTILLAILLIPILRRLKERNKMSSPARLTIVGSDMALWTKFEDRPGKILDHMDSETEFDGMSQYGKTKLLLLMFVSKLAKTVPASEGVIFNVMNPSSVRGTELMRDSKGQYLVQAFVYLTGILFGRNLRDGTRQYLHAALVLDQESHGSFVDWVIRP